MSNANEIGVGVETPPRAFLNFLYPSRETLETDSQRRGVDAIPLSIMLRAARILSGPSISVLLIGVGVQHVLDSTEEVIKFFSEPLIFRVVGLEGHESCKFLPIVQGTAEDGRVA